MASQRIVVDGSNIATEGRNLPSLAQLESALEELRREQPEAEITVVVDATFAHRIDPSELARFEESLAAGAYLIPPAGAIGRGDAFVLRIAEKSDAVVLSNDSFQEFHGDHGWLFDAGRLLGASPVPGVGWIFIPRNPVRGVKSRAATRGVRNLPPLPVPKSPPPGRRGRTAQAMRDDEPQEGAAVVPSAAQTNHRVATSVAAVNDPTTFITFIASHPVGGIIEAEVESFTSHGAIIRFQGVHCYAPLSGLGSPPPRSPREVLKRGEIRGFVIRGLDPLRRGVELSLPEAESVVDEAEQPAGELAAVPRRRSRRSVTAAGADGAVPTPAADLTEESAPAPRREPRKRTAPNPPPEASVPAKRSAPTKSAAKVAPTRARTERRTTAKSAPVDPSPSAQPSKRSAKAVPAKRSAPTKSAAKAAPTRARAERRTTAKAAPVDPSPSAQPSKRSAKAVPAKRSAPAKSAAKMSRSSENERAPVASSRPRRRPDALTPVADVEAAAVRQTKRRGAAK